QRSRQRWQRALDHRSSNLRLSDDGRQLAGAKPSEADAEPKAIPVRHIERRPDRVLPIRCFRIRSMHWRHHCVQECRIALRVWEHLQRVERGPVGCQIDAADDTVIHSGCSLPIHHRYLASRNAETPQRGFSFTRTLLAIAGAVGFLAVLYDMTFLYEYQRVH